MFSDLDETIRQLLIKDVPLDLSEVDISFEAPDRDWSGRLSRPTVNCFLYDVRENVELRQTDWDTQRRNGSASSRRLPARIDVTYQITVWARAPEDEHGLLWRVLLALFRNPNIPEELLQGSLRDQVFPTRAVTAQPSQARANPAELWQALDNRIRPALTYTVTVPLDPDQVFTSPMVFTTIFRLFGNATAPTGAPVASGTHIRGQVRARGEVERGIAGVKVLLKESGAEFVTDAEGRFAFKVVSSPITLVASAPGRKETTRRVEVPASEYDIEL